MLSPCCRAERDRIRIIPRFITHIIIPFFHGLLHPSCLVFRQLDNPRRQGSRAACIGVRRGSGYASPRIAMISSDISGAPIGSTLDPSKRYFIVFPFFYKTLSPVYPPRLRGDKHLPLLWRRERKNSPLEKHLHAFLKGEKRFASPAGTIAEGGTPFFPAYPTAYAIMERRRKGDD